MGKPSQTIRWNFCQISRIHLTWQDSSVFLCNFLAIIPLAWIIGKSTEDLSSAVGQTLGGLLNASFGRLGRDHWNWIKLQPRRKLRSTYQKWGFGTSISGPGIYIYIYIHIIEKDQVASLLEGFIIIQKKPGFLKMVATTFKVADLSPIDFRKQVVTAGLSRHLNIGETRVWRLWFRAKSTTLAFSRFLWFWRFATLKSVVSMGWWFPNLYIENGCLNTYPIGDELLPTWGLYIS